MAGRTDPHYWYMYSPEWYGSEEGWWLRMGMSVLMVFCLGYGVNAWRGNSIDRRIAELESRE